MARAFVLATTCLLLVSCSARKADCEDDRVVELIKDKAKSSRLNLNYINRFISSSSSGRYGNYGDFERRQLQEFNKNGSYRVSEISEKKNQLNTGNLLCIAKLTFDFKDKEVTSSWIDYWVSTVKNRIYVDVFDQSWDVETRDVAGSGIAAAAGTGPWVDVTVSND